MFTALCLFIGTILFAVSFDTLTPLEFGIKYNDITKEIDDSGAFYNGRYFTGLGSSFIKYSSTWNLIKFKYGDIRAWTQEGQLIYINMALYWEHDRENIVEFYHRYGNGGFDQTFRDVATRAVKKVTTQYTASEFFSDREQIGREMRHSLREAFRIHGVLVQAFAMDLLDLPNEFEEKVREKVVTAQEVKTQDWYRKIDVAHAEISVISGEGDALVSYKLADAEATAAKIRADAIAEGQAMVREAEKTYYGELQTALGLLPSELLQIRWSRIMETLQKDYEATATPLNFAIGFDSPIVTVS
jgi:regulator of protease activity HflC (stomatin/prohibitin superfamily)